MTCGITQSGELYCWGMGAGCRIGNDRCDDGLYPTPTAATTSASFRSVSVGGVACAIDADDAVHCWGGNHFGELGIGHGFHPGHLPGTDASTARPLRLDSGPQFATVTAGMHHSCGVSTSGVALCWGRKGWGGLGTGELQWVLEPRAVPASIIWR
jgi:alpha-tubulin suppressor-like RCC1 family protein